MAKQKPTDPPNPQPDLPANYELDAPLTPAAALALSRDDLANLLVATTPGGIEAQEADGQRRFVAAETLPIRSPWPQLEAMGVVRGQPTSELFVSVQLPAGWKKQATDHSMWSDLLDDKGRKRASIFYKAAFYDRSAHLHLERRYGFDAYIEAGKGRYRVAITDCGVPVHEIGQRRDRDYPAQDRLEAEAKAWLYRSYPDWRNEMAYWD